MAYTSFRSVGNKDRLVDRIVTEIQDQIMTGKLTPGMMLPPERELTEQLGVSRTALREAVRMLVTKGLVEPRPGVGTVVKLVTSEQITEPLSIMILQGGQVNLDHLNQVRHILEVEIAEAAAREATPEDIERLQAVLEELFLARDEPAEFNRVDAEFHLALAEASHNPLLAILLNSVRKLIENVRELLENYPNLADEVLPDHQRIYEAVAERQPEASRLAMLYHLEHAREIQIAYLESKEAGLQE